MEGALVHELLAEIPIRFGKEEGRGKRVGIAADEFDITVARRLDYIST
jgi:hypothetical protein